MCANLRVSLPTSQRMSNEVTISIVLFLASHVTHGQSIETPRIKCMYVWFVCVERSQTATDDSFFCTSCVIYHHGNSLNDSDTLCHF